MNKLTKRFISLLLASAMLILTCSAYPIPAAAKTKATDGKYYLDLEGPFWVGGEQEWFHVYDQEGHEVSLDSISQSKKIFDIEKEAYSDEDDKRHYEIYIEPCAAGKATVTVTFTNTDGSSGKASFTLEVKKYPRAIKSLKVDGKTVRIANNVKQGKETVNQLFIYRTKYKKTSPKVKMVLNKGWKIKNVRGTYEIGTGDYYETKKIAKSKITKGKTISFPKKYDRLYIRINLVSEKGNALSYLVDLER